MTWDAVSAKWERGYAEAAAYYAEHQNLDVPQKYVTESGLKLGNWVAYQRQSYQEKISEHGADPAHGADRNALGRSK